MNVVELGITSLWSPGTVQRGGKLLAARYLPFIPQPAYLTNLVVATGGAYWIIAQLDGLWVPVQGRNWVNPLVGFPKGIPGVEPDHP